MTASISCAAVMAIRNERLHLRRSLDELTSNGIEVVVIDDESTDGSYEICQQYLSDDGLISLIRRKWEGFLDLESLLNQKREIIETLSHDWVIHIDADEFGFGST